MLKKVLCAMSLVMLLGVGSAFAAKDECAKTEDCKDGKVCYLAETPKVCIEKKSLEAGKKCVKSVVCKNSCVKEDGKPTKDDGSEKGKCN